MTTELTVESAHARLMTSERALEYLASRRVSPGAIHHFQLGYFDASEYAMYYDRLLCPVLDPYGEFLTFQGRALYDWERAERPKYWHGQFPDHTPKGRALYGLHECAEAIVRKGYCIVTEGPFDPIALWDAGEPAVCLLSANFSTYQAMLLRRYTDHIVTWLDENKAGKRGTQRIFSEARDFGFRLTNVTRERYHQDPSEAWATGGHAALRPYLEKIR